MHMIIPLVPFNMTFTSQFDKLIPAKCKYISPGCKLIHGDVNSSLRKFKRRGGEVVTRGSAKPLCEGSIPFRASNFLRKGTRFLAK